ncbi:MAG: hypothetical protein IJ003_05430 [Candidatus Gastranaerophilales bacterium]|nr:hypothetical protein [Candidatus Gastranaerophilales bacterium]
MVNGNNNNGEGGTNYPNSNEPPEDDELCDCNEQYLDSLIFKLEEGQGDAQSLADDYKELESKLTDSQKHFEEIIQSYKNMLQEVENEIKQHLTSCNNGLSEVRDEITKKIDKLSILIKTVFALIEFNKTQEKVAFYFITQYGILLHEAYVLKRAGMDKYRHSVANCQGAQLGEFGEMAATIFSDFKEYFDQWEDVYAKSHGVTIEEAKADSERDQVANRLGRLRGRENPTCDCADLMKDLIPKSHRDKY